MRVLLISQYFTPEVTAAAARVHAFAAGLADRGHGMISSAPGFGSAPSAPDAVPAPVEAPPAPSGNDVPQAAPPPPAPPPPPPSAVSAPPPPQAPTPAANAGGPHVSEGARLLATQMAIAGSSRDDIARRLQDEFGVLDPTAILNEIGA